METAVHVVDELDRHPSETTGLVGYDATKDFEGDFDSLKTVFVMDLQPLFVEENPVDRLTPLIQPFRLKDVTDALPHAHYPMGEHPREFCRFVNDNDTKFPNFEFHCDTSYFSVLV